MSGRPRSRRAPADSLFQSPDSSLVDVVDNVLTKGVVLTGDLTLALADVDLIYAKLSVLLCAADRVLPPHDGRPVRTRARSGPPRRAGSRA